MIERVRAFWSRLTRAQQVSFSVLGAAICVCAVLTIRTTLSADYRVVTSGERGELERIGKSLRAQGIQYRLREVADSLTLEVPRRDYVSASLQLPKGGAAPDRTAAGQTSAGRTSVAGSSTPGMSLWGMSGVGKSASRSQERRIREARIAESIRQHPKVDQVDVYFREGERGPFDPPGVDDKSATVSLFLSGEVAELTASEVHGIRKLVSGAFGLAPRSIQIVDQFGKSYSPASETLEAESRVASTIKEKVQHLYLGEFTLREIRLSVVVQVEAKSSLIEETKFGHESLLLNSQTEEFPEDRGSFHRTEDQIVKTEESKKTIQLPAGDVKSVSIDLRLDLQAIRDVLARRATIVSDFSQASKSLEEMIRVYTDEEEGRLLKLLAHFPEVEATVSARVLNANEIVSIPDDMIARASPLGSMGDQSVEMILIGLGGFSILVIFFWMLRARRNRRREGLEDIELSRRMTESSKAPRGFTACHGTLELAREIDQMVRERQEVAQSILRFWLSSPENEGRSRCGSDANAVPDFTSRADSLLEEVSHSTN